MSINVAESGLSVRLLDFPAVTVCQDENDNYMDRWYFIEALLNMIDLQCQRCEQFFCPNKRVREYRLITVAIDLEGWYMFYEN